MCAVQFHTAAAFLVRPLLSSAQKSGMHCASQVELQLRVWGAQSLFSRLELHVDGDRGPTWTAMIRPASNSIVS